jgi:DNA polymerase-3 subunit chi
MAQIDFYLLPGNDLSGLMLFCSRLCEKACEQRLRLHVQTSDSLETEALNETLWSFRSESFLPHTQASATDQIIEPISFSHETFSPQNKAAKDSGLPDLIVYTQPLLAPHWHSTVRTALLINNNERLLQASRGLYKQLTQQGHTLNTHDLRKR